MSVIYNVLKDIRKANITKNYAGKGRYIPQKTYVKLKQKKECDHCHKKFNGVIPEIHHIVSIKDGGTNEEYNLMAVHPKCHFILDERNEKKRNARNG
jgi:5-methylcytosine-specific restriction endonuclease McrA